MTNQQIKAGLLLYSLLESMREEKRTQQEVYYLNIFKEKMEKAFKTFRQVHLDNFSMIHLEANEAFKASEAEFKETFEISIPKVVFYMVDKHKEIFKPYKIKPKHLQALVSLRAEEPAFNSLKVANSIMSKL